MSRDRSHLPLPEVRGKLPRRRRPAPTKVPQPDRRVHGEKLREDTERAVHALKNSARVYPEGFQPANIVKVTLHPKGNLDEAVLARMKLRLLGEKERKALVVSVDAAGVEEVTRRLREYADPGAKEVRGEIDHIQAIEVLTASDRTGRRLRSEPFRPEEVAAVDIELWHAGDREGNEVNLDKIEAKLRTGGFPISDRYLGNSLVLIRARINTAILSDLLEFSEIKEIDRPARPGFEQTEVFRAKLDDFAFRELPLDVVGIVVMDSGVVARHPLLDKVMGDAQVFPDKRRELIPSGPEDCEGHGTAVSSIAAYGDLKEQFDRREFVPEARLFSAKVTDDDGSYDENTLLEHQLQEVIEYHRTYYPQARVFNISLGDPAKWHDGGYQFHFAAAVDELAYRFRDEEIVFVISAGNFEDIDPEEAVKHYPGYLLSPESRIIDPATAALALTVGGLSAGKVGMAHDDTDVKRIVAGEPGFPSPFTRTGPGVMNAIKPELVEFAGDWEFTKLRPARPTDMGILAASHGYSSSGNLFGLRVGTSFAAPKVACMAARLMRRYPEYSSNLIRALLVHSAAVPAQRPDDFLRHAESSEEVTRVYGYGKPDFERAVAAGSNDAWLCHEDVMELDTFKVLELPEIPGDFFDRKGSRRLKVTLAYDPPCRHTRSNYLGVVMGFELFRNVDVQNLVDIYRNWDTDKDKAPNLSSLRSGNRVSLLPGSEMRGNSTVQSAWIELTERSVSRWVYSRGEPLYLVIVCQRKWAPKETQTQRMAVVLSVFHDDEKAEIYSVLEARLRARASIGG